MLVKSSRDNELLALDTSSVLLDNTSVGEGSPVAYMTSSVPVVPGAICATPVHSDGETRHGRPRSPINAAVLGAAGEDDGQEPEMKAPHVSTLYEKQAVMAKHFGVTQEQALRTQALLRLGVTDEDVRIAERLMAARSSGDTIQSKAEWLLGYTHAQMSYRKALEVLGVSEAVVEEERARRLGELGVASWGAARSGAGGLSGREMDDRCGGFFTKRRRPSQDAESTLGTTLPGEIAFAPAHARVWQLEEVCQSQMTRIRQLETQLATLSARSPSRSTQ